MALRQTHSCHFKTAYTRVSGIWQTVWLEEVPARHIADLKLRTAIKPSSITITPHLPGGPGGKVRATASFEGKVLATTEGTGDLVWAKSTVS